MSGVGVPRFMARAKSAGVRLMLIYIGLDRPQLSLMRVAERVVDGGHHVPHADISRRYPASLANLGAALTMSDRSWILDNSGARRRLLLSLGQGEIRHVVSYLPKWATMFIPDRFRTKD